MIGADPWGLPIRIVVFSKRIVISLILYSKLLFRVLPLFLCLELYVGVLVP